MNEQNIRVLDLFSGIGGFALAAEIANAMVDAKIRSDGQFQAKQQGRDTTGGSSAPSFTPLAHAEVEPFACAVYHRHFPDSVCFGGVQNVTRDSLLERCGVLPDVVCGGFPCQPHSCAGNRLASADERDLWGECRRILGDVRPRFALFENVGGLLTSESGLFFNRVLSDLAALRYACQWQVVPASAVGAPHRRDRVWMLCWDELADGKHTGLQGGEITGSTRGERTKPSDEQPVRLCGTGLSWPAIAGHWPSRPGEPQHGWEPPRVVANASGQRGGRDTGGIQQADGRQVDGLPRQSDEPGEGDVGNAASQRSGTCGAESAGQQREASTAGTGEQTGVRQTKPALGLLPDGLPASVGGDWPQVHNRVAQLKAAGNAIVPEVAAALMLAILRVYEMEGKANKEDGR